LPVRSYCRMLTSFEESIAHCNHDWIRTNFSFAIKSLFQLNLGEVLPTNGLMIIKKCCIVRYANRSLIFICQSCSG